VSAPPSGVSASVPATAIGADTRSTFVSLGAPLSSVPPIVDTKAVSIASVVTSAGAPPTSQEPAGGGIGQSYTAAVPVAAPPAPTVVVKQPEPVRPYTGTTSYKAYKENFEKDLRLRYDTRCYFNVRSKADISQLNLPHGTDN